MGSAGTNGPLWSVVPDAWGAIVEPFHTPLFAAMLDAAQVREGTTVLDAGCGAGTAAAMALGRGATVTGLDAAEGLLRVARDKARDATFVLGDIESLDFDDDSFDVVFAANSLQYAENLIRTLREFGRVCKPDGRVVAGLFGPPEQVAYTAVFEAAAGVMPPPPAGATPGGPFALSDEGILEGAFNDAGLTVLATGEANCPFVYRGVDHHWEGFRSGGPTQNMLKIVGEHTLRDAVDEACRPLVREDGTIRFAPNVYVYVVAQP